MRETALYLLGASMALFLLLAVAAVQSGEWLAAFGFGVLEALCALVLVGAFSEEGSK